jgi:TP901 family phage tail tape measure protein
MAVAQMRVPTMFTAVDRFSDVVSRMTSKTSHFSKSTVGAINRVDHRLNNMWGSMNSISQMAIGGGVGGLFYYAGKDIMDYETAIHSLGAVTGTVVGSMNKEIESLGKETGRSVIDIAKGFENVGSKMSEYLKNPEALKSITRASILLANASRMSVDDATEGLTSLMNQFGLKADKALHLVNKLSAGEDVGAATISQTIDMTRQFAASIRMAGGTAEEAIALVQATSKTMGNIGVGRGFRNIAIDMLTGKGMDRNKLKALKMVGADIDIISAKSTHFYDRLLEIKKLLGNNQAMGMFFKKTGMEAGGTFLRDFGMYEEYLGKIRANNTAIAKAAKNTSTLSYAIEKLKATFTNFVVTNNDANGALGMTKSLVGWMTDNMGTLIKVLISVLAVFLAWKAIVGVIALINGVMATFNAIMAVHRFIVLWATMTNVSYAASLWAVAAATLAAYWPLLLIAGALGVLVYSMWDTKSATDAMVGGQISGLDKSNMAWKNSTSVMAGELGKQQSLLKGNQPVIQSPSMGKGILGDIAQRKAQRKAEIAAMPPMRTIDGPLFNPDKTPVKYVNTASEAETPKNLAGTNTLTEEKIINLMNSKGGTLDINLKAPDNYDMDVDSKNVKGIDVKTSSNQGKR